MCMCVRVPVSICTRLCLYVHMRVCMCACVCAFVCASLYVCALLPHRCCSGVHDTVLGQPLLKQA